jgi:hypothetical protein
MGTQRRKLTDEERAERRARDRELTEQAVARLRCSAGWQAWLAVRARTGLRRYSLRNQLMIALQDPAATRVAGFRAWLALGYCVRRGETSRIGVWAHREPSKTRLQAWRENGADPAERPKPFYRLEPVFDTLSRDRLGGFSRDAVARLKTLDRLAWTLPVLERLAAELGVTVAFEPLADGHDGYYRPSDRRIAISTAVAVNQ